MRLSPGKTRKLAGIARKHGAVRASLFGSFARGDARPDSDPEVDVVTQRGRQPRGPLPRCRRRPRRSLRAAIGAQEMALPPCDDLLYACGVIGVHRVNTLEQARLRLHAMAGLPVKPIEAGEFALQGSHGPGHVAD